MPNARPHAVIHSLHFKTQLVGVIMHLTPIASITTMPFPHHLQIPAMLLGHISQVVCYIRVSRRISYISTSSLVVKAGCGSLIRIVKISFFTMNRKEIFLERFLVLFHNQKCALEKR